MKAGIEEGFKAGGSEGVEEEDEEVLVELEEVAEVALHDPHAVDKVKEERLHLVDLGGHSKK